MLTEFRVLHCMCSYDIGGDLHLSYSETFAFKVLTNILNVISQSGSLELNFFFHLILKY